MWLANGHGLISSMTDDCGQELEHCKVAMVVLETSEGGPQGPATLCRENGLPRGAGDKPHGLADFGTNECHKESPKVS